MAFADIAIKTGMGNRTGIHGLGLLCYMILVVAVVCFIGPFEAMALIVGSIVLVLSLSRPLWLVFVLPFAAALSGWHISVVGFNVRLDQTLAVWLGIVFILHLMFGAVHVKITKVPVLVLLLLLVNVISSILSQDPKYSLSQAVNFASATLCFFVPFLYITERDQYDSFVRAVLVAGFLGMAYGIAAFMLRLMQLEIGGANIGTSVVTFGVFGSMREPNIFGSYSASMLVLGSALLAHSTRFQIRSRLFLQVFTLVALCALILSFARAAWVAAAIGLLITWSQERSVRLTLKRLLMLIGVSSAVLVILVFSGAISAETYSYKVLNLFNFEEGTGQWRAIIWEKAWVNFTTSPLLGNGTFSYAYLDPDSMDVPQSGNDWVSNLLLLTAHDTGILGVLLLIILLWAILSTTRKARTTVVRGDLHAQLVGYGAAFWCLLIAYMATSAFSLGFTWILVALTSLGAEFADQDAALKIRGGGRIS